MVGQDPDLHPMHSTLVTFVGGFCVVQARTDSQVREVIREQYGLVNGSMRLYDLPPDELSKLEQQADFPTFIVH